MIITRLNHFKRLVNESDRAVLHSLNREPSLSVRFAMMREPMNELMMWLLK